MLNRRTFLAATGGGLAISELPFAESASIVPTNGSVPQPVLPITEQLMYSTVRLFNQKQVLINSQSATQTNWGTGFVFNFFNTKDFLVPAIVTNRHVAESMGTQCTFNLATRLEDGTADLEHHIPVQLSQFDKSWVAHPEVDLAIFPLAQVFNDLQQQGHRPFTISLEPSLIPTDEELKALLPVEQVLTVGFPGTVWDDVHNLPVFHRGYTATAPYINFKGRTEFLIDIATWPGSSGSPVILFNDTLRADRFGQISLGSSAAVKLLGIVFQVAVQDVSGNLVVQNAPTQVSAQMSVPTNLGVCIRASRILEFEPLLVSHFHVEPPAGYVMRGKDKTGL